MATSSNNFNVKKEQTLSEMFKALEKKHKYTDFEPFFPLMTKLVLSLQHWKRLAVIELENAKGALEFVLE